MLKCLQKTEHINIKGNEWRMRLSKHFSLDEFATSKDFPELAEQISFSHTEIERIRFACAAILEPLRRSFNLSVIVTSGKRSGELNRAVGGHPRSHHLFAGDTGAADIVLPGISPGLVASWLQINVKIRMLIVYPRAGFVHVSFPDSSGIYNKTFFKE